MNELVIAFILMALKFLISYVFINKVLLKDTSNLIKNYMLFMLGKNTFLIIAILLILKTIELERTEFILYLMLFYFATMAYELYIINKSINNK